MKLERANFEKRGKLGLKRPETILIEQAVIIAMVIIILACVMVPKATEAVESAIWTEARLGASQIKQNARTFCNEKGQSWTGWKNVSIYDLGFAAKDLDGNYFKGDSYSILFLGYDDFLITVRITTTTIGAKYFNRCMLTLDEQGNWGYINTP